ncbi:hypothetical protein M758_12G024000 [Ceratodon purpureus]|nr:hypothetical protein M758_12G024000 [Ceratodon purpureus]
MSFVTGSGNLTLSTVLSPPTNRFLCFQLLFKRYSNNFVVNLLGKWKESEYSQSGQLIPVGGLVYYITPPTRYFILAV